jgi:hypothetical protein
VLSIQKQMKISLNNYDFTDFIVHEQEFCGVSSKLIQPQHIGIKFNQTNKIFRSSIWDLEGNLLSAGFPKFTNFGENSENFTVPLSVNGVDFVTKIDGSLVCIDFVNERLNMRTRGTFHHTSLENWADFEYCLNNNPKLVEWLKKNSNYTLLCEITTPNLKIVIDYGVTPQFWLVGAINKNDYSLMIQSELNGLAIELNINRPEVYSFNSIEHCIDSVKLWNGKEGVCLYSQNGQAIHKIKAEIYLKLHRFKENATMDNTIDLFFEYNCPSYNTFLEMLMAQFDFECMQMVLPFVSKIVDSKKKVDVIVAHMKSFVEPLKVVSRKDAALAIVGSYGKTNRSSFMFSLLDGKELTVEQMKKLVYQCL